MPNVFRPSFQRFGPTYGLQKVTIRQKYANHTLAFLDYRFTDKAAYTLPREMTPMTVDWGQSPLGVRRYYGYVNHYETVTGRQDTEAMTRLVAIGTSQVLNSASPTNWSGHTRSGIAREIAKRNNLRSIVHEHNETLDNWSTGTRTDFQALKALADESGFKCWVDGTTVYFLDPRRTLNSAQSQFVPTFNRSNIRESKVTGGTNAPRDSGAVRRRVLHGLDYRTNEFFTATSGSDQYPTETLAVPANTYLEANRIAEALGNHDSDYYTLEMTVAGSANVYPGGLINLSGSRISTDRAGFWMVSEAVHEVTRDDFVTRLVASRGTSVHASLLPSSTLLGARETAGAVVRDGTHWEAEVQEHVNV